MIKHFKSSIWYQYDRLIKNYQSLWSMLLAISLFLLFNTKFYFLFLINSFLLTIILLNNYRCILIALLIFLVAYLVNYLFTSSLKIDNINDNFKVVSLINQKPVIIINGVKVLIFPSHKQTIYHVGDILFVKGKINYTLHNYLHSHNIYYLISNPEIKLVKMSNNLLFKIKKMLSFHPLSLLLLLGIKTPNILPLWNLSLKLHLSHMFVISGFHISGIYHILCKLFYLLKIKNHFYQQSLSLFIIWNYIFWL